MCHIMLTKEYLRQIVIQGICKNMEYVSFLDAPAYLNTEEANVWANMTNDINMFLLKRLEEYSKQE